MSFLLSFGRSSLNLDPAATKSTWVSAQVSNVNIPQQHDDPHASTMARTGQPCFQSKISTVRVLPTSEASTILAGIASLSECIPLASVVALIISCNNHADPRLLSHNQLVKFHRAILVLAPVSQDGSQALLNELFGNVAGRQPASQRSSRVGTAISNGHTLAFLKLAIARLDVVDVHTDILSNQALPEEFLCFSSVECRFRISAARATDGGELNPALLS